MDDYYDIIDEDESLKRNEFGHHSQYHSISGLERNVNSPTSNVGANSNEKNTNKTQAEILDEASKVMEEATRLIEDIKNNIEKYVKIDVRIEEKNFTEQESQSTQLGYDELCSSEKISIGDFKRKFGNKANKSNFKFLYKELQLINLENGFTDNSYRVGENESEICYLQGKILETVEWTGKSILEVPDTAIPYITYNKMNYEQLQYYIYWRTNFRKGNYIITGMRSFYYLCAYELLMDLGGYTPDEILKMLEALYTNFKKYGLTNMAWISEYKKLHNIGSNDNATKKSIIDSIFRMPTYDDELKIINKNYENAFNIICKKSKWKIKDSSFVKKSECINHIRKAVEELLPDVDKLFEKNNLNFTDFLVGVYGKEVKEIQFLPYSGSIWSTSVIEKYVCKSQTFTLNYITPRYPSGEIYITDSEGNIKRKTNALMDYKDPHLSEYIIKYTEMIFRKYFGYEYITWPLELKGALRKHFADGYEYVLSVDEELQAKQKRYIAIYKELPQLLNDCIYRYISQHEEELEHLKGIFVNK